MDRCESCLGVARCNSCGKSIIGFDHIGVRAVTKARHSAAQQSGIWHYARPCGHRSHVPAAGASVKYNGGPLWKSGYSWQNLYWGSYFTTSAASAWIRSIEKATLDIESDQSYSGGLAQYDVGIGRLLPFAIIKTSPPTRISDSQIRQALASWISSGTVSKFGTQGAYNL